MHTFYCLAPPNLAILIHSKTWFEAMKVFKHLPVNLSKHVLASWQPVSPALSSSCRCLLRCFELSCQLFFHLTSLESIAVKWKPILGDWGDFSLVPLLLISVSEHGNHVCGYGGTLQWSCWANVPRAKPHARWSWRGNTTNAWQEQTKEEDRDTGSTYLTSAIMENVIDRHAWGTCDKSVNIYTWHGCRGSVSWFHISLVLELFLAVTFV